MRLLAARAVWVSAFVVAFLGVSTVSAFALPGEVHRYRLNQWTGLDDELTAGYNPLGTYGGATEAANTGRSDDGTTGTPGTPFTCLPATTRCEQGYHFGAGQGLSLDPSIADGGPFTIVLDFMLSISSGPYKVLDFSGRCASPAACDSGLYVTGGGAFRRLGYVFDSGSSVLGPAGGISGDVMSSVALTRTSDGLVSVYDEGVLAFSFTDAGTDAVLTAPVLNFFMDDLFTSTQQWGGFVDSIRIFNVALGPSDLASLELEDLQTSAVSDVPEPGTLLLMGAGLLAIGARLRKRHAT